MSALSWRAWPGLALLTLLTTVLSALAGQHLFARFGLLPGVELLALALTGLAGGLPLLRSAGSFGFRFLVQTAAMVAGAAAGLSLTLPLGLVHEATLGVSTNTLVAAVGVAGVVVLAVTYWLSGQPLLSPDSSSWPGAEEGALDLLERTPRQALLRALALLGGLAAGAWLGVGGVGSGAGALGLGLLGNAVGVTLLALGVFAGPIIAMLLDVDPISGYLPHGVLVGAGLMALLQALLPLAGRLLRELWTSRGGRVGVGPRGVPDRVIGAPLLVSVALVLLLQALAISILLEASTADLDPLLLLTWSAIGAVVAIVLELLAGLLQARTGWVPLLGCGLVLLVLMVRLGLDPAAALLLSGFGLALAPLAAELGQALAVAGRHHLASWGWSGLVAASIGLLVAAAVVSTTAESYLSRAVIAPQAQSLAAVFEVLRTGWWYGPIALAIAVGAFLQLTGGRANQAGLMVGIGLLVSQAGAGWGLLAGLALRALLGVVMSERGVVWLPLLGLGLIIGEALAFVAS